MREPVQIKFGDKTFSIRPLSVGQVRDIEGAILQAAQSPLSMAVSILKIGLRRDHSQVHLDDIEATPSELTEAMTVVVAQGGFEMKTGEAAAAAGSADPQTGPGSSGRVATGLGCRLSEALDEDWAEVLTLFDYWRDHPPIHELAAAYLGVKPRAKEMAPIMSSGDDPSGICGLINQFPSGHVPADR